MRFDKIKLCCLFFLSLLSVPLFSAAEQVEEGFRWRHSVDLQYITADLNEMCVVERTWSAFLKEECRNKNLAVAKIGIVFTVGGKVRYLSRWFSIPDRGGGSKRNPHFC